MSTDYRKTLDVLLQHEVQAERKCRSDKARLHDIEFRYGEQTFWIWADIEIVSDSIRGIALSCFESPWRKDLSKEEAVRLLSAQSIFDKGHLVEWIGKHGRDYPDFLQYMLATEAVRLAAVKYLQHSLEGRKLAT